ncbi:hypothetical protein ES702_04401 [subsurface metagenome]
MEQVGIPLFYLQGMGGGAVLKFRDLFNDGSQFWGWRRYLGLNSGGKSGVEANGRYTLGVQSPNNGQWDTSQSEAPRLFVGVLNYPCEIVTRLDTFTANMGTHAGLFIAKDPIGFGADLHFSIVQRRTVTETGVCVCRDNDVLLASTLVTTLPMWLRMRLGCGSYRGLNVYFDYSLDGLNWTNLWLENTGITYFSLNPPAVGIYVSNFAAHNTSEGSFDHFIMRPRSIN